MKNIFTYLWQVLLLTLFTAVSTYAQTVPPPPPPPSDTSKQAPISFNAGFDVIIKKNGDILYGLVKEVGLELIKYQRTDIPDGPIYTLPRNEVYAISYRNQVKDILSPMTAIKDSVAIDTLSIHLYPPSYKSKYSFRRSSFKTGANFRIGLGFIRGYSKVNGVSDYSSSATFPIVSLAYDVRYSEQMRLGVQMAFGPHKFSKQEYSSYDSTQNNITVKESIFALHVYGKYSFASHIASFQPYILVGIGINSSYIRSEYNISFINNSDKVLQVKSGANAVGIGILARVGTEYYLNNKLRLFGDVGVGPSIVNIGISANVD